MTEVRRASAVVLANREGILTPELCQLCRKGGPGIVTVRGLNGRPFSAHRWPCAEREGLAIDSEGSPIPYSLRGDG